MKENFELEKELLRTTGLGTSNGMYDGGLLKDLMVSQQKDLGNYVPKTNEKPVYKPINKGPVDYTRLG